MLYRAVIQVVLLFGSDTWVLSVAMESMVEGMHTGFMRKIMGKMVRRKADRTWVTTKADVVK